MAKLKKGTRKADRSTRSYADKKGHAFYSGIFPKPVKKELSLEGDGGEKQKNLVNRSDKSAAAITTKMVKKEFGL